MSGLWGPCYLTIITIISLIGQSGSVVRPVVTVIPNWNKVFMGESISLSCNVEPAEEAGPLTYTWYKDNRPYGTAKVIGIRLAELIHSEDYYCVVNGKYRSDTITLNITDPLKVAVILQAPATAVYEGDEVYLRCHSHIGYHTGETIFYRNDQIIQRASEDSYVIQSVDSASRYRCTKEVYFFPKTYSDYVFFPYTDNSPETISVTLNPPWNKILEGDSVTMTCNGLSDTYQWFRYNRKVAEGQSYTITTAKAIHSGSYQCQASRGTGLISDSLKFTLEVREGPVILQTLFPVYPGQDLTLRCHSRPDYTVHWTTLYQNGALIQESHGDTGPVTIPSSQVGAGRYSCEKLLSHNTFAVYTDQASLSVRAAKKPAITVIIPVVVLLLLLVIITVVVVVVRKRRHKQPKMSASQSQNSAPPEGHSEMEVCYADLKLGHKFSRKASPPQPAADDSQVVYSKVRNHK